MKLIRGRRGFFKIPLIRVITLRITLINEFFKTGVFLNYFKRSLNIKECLLYKESVFIIIYYLIIIIILY